VRVLIEMSDHTSINICICTIFQKNREWVLTWLVFVRDIFPCYPGDIGAVAGGKRSCRCRATVSLLHPQAANPIIPFADVPDHASLKKEWHKPTDKGCTVTHCIF
jgi:hypothetical protein